MSPKRLGQVEDVVNSKSSDDCCRDEARIVVYDPKRRPSLNARRKLCVKCGRALNSVTLYLPNNFRGKGAGKASVPGLMKANAGEKSGSLKKAKMYRSQADYVSIAPQAGPQEDFLGTSADIVVYGGAAGGGKTFGLLLECLRNHQRPNFNFAVFRRTSPQITANGGLWDASAKLFPLFGAEPMKNSLSWRFGSGVVGRFAHLQHDKNVHDWQGTEIPLICFDELTHFSEEQFFYLLSRNRSTCGVKPYIRATTNPAAGSWVKKFLAPWLHKEYHTPAAPGEIRYFTRVNGEIVWVDADWRDDEGLPAKSVTFIFSSVYDNKILLKADPGYLVNLKSLPLAEQSRLLHGDWDVLEGAYFTEWSEAKHTKLPCEVPGWYRFFGGLDYGKAAPFCFLLMASDEEGNILVLDEIYETRLQPSEQASKAALLLEQYGVDPKRCPIWADPSIFPPREPKARAGHPGKYIAEEYWGEGLNAIPANNDRMNGWARVREYLHTAGGLTVFKGRCPNLIRTMGILAHDPGNPEDLDTMAEDHAADALRYGLMGRPVRSKEPEHVPHTMVLQNGREMAPLKRLPHALQQMPEEEFYDE